MKKLIVAATLTLTAGAAVASTTIPRLDAQLVNGYLEVAPVTRAINNAQTGTLTAIAARGGFVKNNFDFTVSSNVVAGVSDDFANNRFGVIAGSNKGYGVYTGSSVGGSIAQCGALIADKNTANLAATLVVTGNLVLNNPNGCGRQ